jgi:hypothetical protein
VSLYSLANLPIGGFLIVQRLVDIQRLFQDVFQVRESSFVQSARTKSFNLTDCYRANGGAPPVRTATATRIPLPTATATRTPTRTASPTTGPSATPSRTPTTTPVAVGDWDGDGVRDGFDFCKYVPGTANGCPDPDGDGIGGPLDMCPNSPGDRARFGCPDTDGDGVHDGYDLCPSFAGSPNAYGCPDNDNDGVPNAIDWCPLQVPDAGVTQFQGCNDPDRDGFVNGARVPAFFVDNCPAASGVNYANGCPPGIATGLPTIVPTVNYSLSLFAFAAQQGAFSNLVVDSYKTAVPSCATGTYGFCLGN